MTLVNSGHFICKLITAPDIFYDAGQYLIFNRQATKDVVLFQSDEFPEMKLLPQKTDTFEESTFCMEVFFVWKGMRV